MANPLTKFMLRFSSVREAIFLIIRPGLWFRQNLDPALVLDCPILQFTSWYSAAKRQVFSEFPNAVFLSTVSVEGLPEGRMVLLKSYNQEGFVFYTNKNSKKGKALARVPFAELCFYWPGLQRQVRIRGPVNEVSSVEADEYFQSRPLESKLAAWASNQSIEIDSRLVLENRYAEAEAQYGSEVPRPDYWSGFRVCPEQIEFWQLRLNRMHDRLLYKKVGSGKWEICRLSP